MSKFFKSLLYAAATFAGRRYYETNKSKRWTKIYTWLYEIAIRVFKANECVSKNSAYDLSMWLGMSIGPASKTNWAALDKLTNEEIRQAVADDPDAAPILDKEWFEKSVLRIRNFKSFFSKLSPADRAKLVKIARESTEVVNK